MMIIIIVGKELGILCQVLVNILNSIDVIINW